MANHIGRTLCLTFRGEVLCLFTALLTTRFPTRVEQKESEQQESRKHSIGFLGIPGALQRIYLFRKSKSLSSSNHSGVHCRVFEFDLGRFNRPSVANRLGRRGACRVMALRFLAKVAVTHQRSNELDAIAAPGNHLASA